MTVRRRPTRATAAVAGCGVLLILLSGPAQAMWLAVTGALVLGIPLASVVSRPGLDTATIELGMPSVATVGDRLRVEVGVRATGRRIAVHRLELTGPPLGDVAVLVDPLRAGGLARVAADVVAAHRGSYVTQAAVAATGAPFGLLLTRRTWQLPCHVDVAAQVVPVAPHVMRALTGAADVAPEMRRGPGDEVHAVRDFRSGDAMRDVHWRSTARAGRLVVREHERAVPTRTAVAIAGGEPGVAFEALVVAATSVAHATWRAGEPVDVARCTPYGVVVTRSASRHGLHAWSAGVLPAPADVSTVVPPLLAEGAPSGVVLAVGPGVSSLAGACADLARAGSHVTVIALPEADLSELAPGVVVRVLDRGVELPAALAGRRA